MITTSDAITSIIDWKSNKVRMTETLINKINNLDSRYKKAVRDWLASSKVEKFKTEQLDYEKLVKEIKDIQIEEIADKFQGWDEQPEFTLALSEDLKLLKDEMPVNNSITLFGVDERLPSSFEQTKYIVKYKVFNNPMIVIDNLNAGVLSGLEIDALQMFYPSILQTIQYYILQGITDLKEKGIESLGHKKMKLINIILQIPRLSPDKLQELQASFAPKEDGKTDVQVEDIQTDTQRIANK